MLGKLTNSWQLYCLFVSCGFGFWTGFLYELFTLCRRAALHKIAVVLWDVAFCLLSAILLFLFALPVSGGVLRWYIVFGTAVGFFAFRVTIGRFVETAVKGISRAACWLSCAVKRLFSPLLQPIRRAGYSITRQMRKTWENIRNFFKKHLKQPRNIVYNQNDIIG